MKIIDSFTFFNEFDILELRLRYLNDVVDYFIISESNYTHAGKLKPYYLDEVLPKIPKNILDKIISIKYEPDISLLNFDTIVEKYNPESSHWKIEKGQREYIIEYIRQNMNIFSLDDILMVSDVDEIPKKEVVKTFKNFPISDYICSAISLQCKMFYYNFMTYNTNFWAGTVFSDVLNFSNNGISFFRTNRFALHFLQDAAWHFSYFGGYSNIKTKLESFAHQEFNTNDYKDKKVLEHCILNKINLFDDKQFLDYEFEKYPDELKSIIIDVFPKEYYV
jgi:beta-1,4-mannosyl-glycoprotein beta-1,4-N-acetylglucosaminyltransferase